MATVLEELLVKIGFDVDKSGLDSAQKSIESATKGATKADEKQNKVSEDRLDTMERTGEQLDRQSGREKERKRNEEESVGRGKMLNKEMGALKGLLGKVAGGWVAAGAAVAFYTGKQAKANDANIKFARSTGINTEKLQALQFAAKQEGATAEEVTGTLASLSSVAGASVDGVQNIGLALLGINTWKPSGELKNSIELFNEITDSVQGLDKETQLQRLVQVGISPALLPLVQQGRKSIAQYVKEFEALGAETESQQRASEELQNSIGRFGETARGESRDVRQALTLQAADMLETLRVFAKTPRAISELFSDEGRERARKRAEVVSKAPRGIFGRIISQPEQKETTITNNITVNANGLNEQQAKRVATEVITDAIRTSKENNDQRTEL